MNKIKLIKEWLAPGDCHPFWVVLIKMSKGVKARDRLVITNKIKKANFILSSAAIQIKLKETIWEKKGSKIPLRCLYTNECLHRMTEAEKTPFWKDS